MSVENARRLVLKMGSDATFCEQVANVGPAEKRVLLESAGFGDVTRDEIHAAATASVTGELTDAELEAVAGGSAWDWAEAVACAVVGAAAAAAV